MKRAPKPDRRRPRILPIFIASFVVAAAIGAAFLLRRAGGSMRPRGWKGQNVLFVTVDTLRADRLPAYGRTDVRTPTIDALAARGVLFERCETATPLTLPSHTTIFSGTLPLHHGVRDNGAFTVPPELPLLAELFHAGGYTTAAFVSAFVLDSRWKLNRGFDTYFDQFDTRQANILSIGDIERPAGEVVDAVLDWVKRRDRTKPFFVWVHFYDPHAPYAPPPPFAEEYKDRPYLGEIAYVDSELGRLLRVLADEGIADRTAVVFAGDHGESLGDHGEDGHGFFVYEATLHVPLVFAPSVSRGGRAARRGEVVSLVDVMPTVADLAGLPIPAGVQGRSLVPLLSGSGRFEKRPAYSETWYPRFHFGWSDLAALQDGRYKLIESSAPELYDLAADPGEKVNLVAREKERYLALKRQLTSLADAASRNALNARPAVSDPEAVRKLASLGYLSGGSADAAAASGGPRAAPLEKIGLYNKLNAALADTASDPAKAEAVLKDVLREDPAMVDARVALANVYLRQRRYKEAIPALEESVRGRPADATLVYGLAMALRMDGRTSDSDKLLENRLANGMKDARIEFLLGTSAEDRGDRAAADAWFAKAIAAEPSSAGSRSALSEVLLRRNDLDGAEREARQAVALDPRVEGAHYCLAAVAERRGRAADAFDEYGREIANNAVSERSFQGLMALARRLPRLEDEAALLEESARRHPKAPLPKLYAARNLLDRGQDFESAVRLAESGLELARNDREAAFGCFLLADLYNRLGDSARSEEFARRGQTLARSAPAGS
ncbi:MAG TPA: sulfatase-like hydrolase/transferase [Thermoanaerobaculia bacterium]|nr:sulfatase-like hydrolase/transferase [Thermoanaerobaculia bacterium]